MAWGKNDNPTITDAPPRSACEGCGKCCEAIWLGDDLNRRLKELMRYGWAKGNWVYTGNHAVDGDLAFVFANWTPISTEEAIRRNPNLANWRAPIEGQGREFGEFFECVNYDWDTGRCKIHDNLPNVCSGYPWYGRVPNPSHLFYADDCHYKRDIEGQYIEDGVLRRENEGTEGTQALQAFQEMLDELATKELKVE